MTATAERLGLRAAPWLLWFGVLGSGIAWSLHTLVNWGLAETVCRSGHDAVFGVPLRPLLGVFVGVFLTVSVASTLVAWRAWRSLDTGTAGDGGADGDDLAALRQQRAAVMALVGFGSGLLFSTMILFGGIAVLVLPACAGSSGVVSS